MPFWFTREGRRALLDLVFRTQSEFAPLRAQAREISAATERLITEAPEIRRRVVWKIDDGAFTCEHSQRPDATHEVVIMVLGQAVWTGVFPDAAAAEKEIARMHELFAG